MQQLSVVDTTAPVVTAPVDITVEATGVETAVTLSGATAVDTVSGDLVAATSDTGPFTIGAHLITWSATDQAGNTGYAYQYVTVVDTTAPVISGAKNLSVSTNKASGVASSQKDIAAMIDAVVAHDVVDGEVAVSKSYPTVFAIGETEVSFSAVDSHGNASTLAVQVAVIFDDKAPVLTVPKHLVIYIATDAPIKALDGRIVRFLATARAIDQQDGALKTNHDAPAEFMVGITTVTFTATDNAGNQALGQSTVTVIVDPEKARKKKRRNFLMFILGIPEEPKP